MSNMRKKVILGTFLIACLLFLMLVIFSPRYMKWMLGTKEDRVACYELSDEAAIRLVLDKISYKLNNNLVGEKSLQILQEAILDVTLKKVTEFSSTKGDGYYYKEVVFSRKENASPFLGVSIFEDCEIQWQEQ